MPASPPHPTYGGDASREGATGGGGGGSGAARPPSALSAAAFTSSLDRFAVSPVLVGIAADLGASLAATVPIASGYFLSYGLLQPVWGILSDRYGRVRLLRGALLAAALASVCSALAPSLPTLIAGRVVAGGLYGAIVPTSLTYVGDTVAPSRRQGALTDLMAAIAAGTAVATALAGALSHVIGWRGVFLLPGAAALACWWGARGLPEPPLPEAGHVLGPVRRALAAPWALLVYALAFVEGAILLGPLTLLAPALQDRGVGAAVAGLATAAYGVGVWVFARVVRGLSRTWPTWRLMLVGGSAMGVGYAVVTAYVAIPTVVVTTVLLGAGWAFLHSSLQTWATSVVPAARGTVVAFFAASLFVGSSLSTATAGPYADRGQWPVVFGVAAVVAVPLTAVAVLARRRAPLA